MIATLRRTRCRTRTLLSSLALSLVLASTTASVVPAAPEAVSPEVEVALARLTALRAATIEPTMQKLISKGSALKHKPPNNPTVLSSMCKSFRL